jgi:hypothetical protein
MATPSSSSTSPTSSSSSLPSSSSALPLQRSRSRHGTNGSDELRRSISYDLLQPAGIIPVRSANIVYDHIKGDPRIDSTMVTIGFGFTTALSHATLEQAFDTYSLADHPTPFNRIAFFKYKVCIRVPCKTVKVV